jgi:hypothetical protein
MNIVIIITMVFYTINASNNQKINAIVVRDAGGRIVKTQNSNQSQSENIAISDLSKGVYFASVYSNAGVKTLKLLN